MRHLIRYTFHYLLVPILVLGVASACAPSHEQSSQYNSDPIEPVLTDSDTKEPEPAEQETPEPAPSFVSHDFQYRSTLRSFSAEILEGYSQCELLEQDLQIAAGALADSYIQQQATYLKEQEERYVIYEFGVSDNDVVWEESSDATSTGSDTADFVDADFDAPAAVAKTTALSSTESVAELAADGGASDTSSKVQTDDAAAESDEEGFSTNNQVQGVEEADIIKSDGQWVYVVYGNKIVVHDLSGEIINDTYELSNISSDNLLEHAYLGSFVPGNLTKVEKKDVPEENTEESTEPAFEILPVEETSVVTASDTDDDKEELDTRTATDAEYAAEEKIMADEDIEPAHDIAYYPQTSENIAAILFQPGKLIVISSGYYPYNSVTLTNDYTRVSILSVDDEGEIASLHENVVSGSYQSARQINGQVHLVTLNRLSTYKLTSDLSSWKIQRELGLNRDRLSAEQYLSAAYAKANILVPAIAEEIMMVALGGEPTEDACQNIIQINNMHQDLSEDDPELDDKELNEGRDMDLLRAFVQITSLDPEDAELSHTSGAFLPADKLDMYASQDLIVLGGFGWQRFETKDWAERTFLISFAIEEGVAQPKSVGSVPGRVLNQFAFDQHEGHLRVASTINSVWGPVGPFNQWKEISPSDNLVTVLKLGEEELEQVGQVRGLGEGESIYAVRFLGDRAFIVTFRQIDPFYTLDLSDPTQPEIKGELKIPGFSNYLHPLGEDHVIAVGQDANERGRTKGLQVAIFDVSDMSDPVQQHKYVVDGAYSEGQHDHKAFRYLASEGVLILPLSYSIYEEVPVARDELIDDSDDEDTEDAAVSISASSMIIDVEGPYWPEYVGYFDGFQVLDLSVEEGISLRGSIEHSRANGCWWSAGHLQGRSMFFSGSNQLLTFKNQSIFSHDLDELDELWEIDLSEEEGDEGEKGWCYY